MSQSRGPIAPSQALPRAGSAAAAGVDPAGVLAFLDAVERDGLGVHSLMVLRHGRVAAEGWWHPYTADQPRQVYSVTKTFTATAVALALGEGLLALDDRVTSFFPGQLPAVVHPRVAELTVHHLLSMSTGHDRDTLPVMTAHPPQDWVRVFLDTPPETPVGSRHVYDNGCSQLLAELILQVTGQTPADYLRPRLFGPLGIDDVGWHRAPGGRPTGFAGLQVTTEAIAALAELYRCDGVHDGRRILPEGWVAAAGGVQIGTEDDEPDWSQGYGYQMWTSRHGYRSDGAYGQFGLVLPEQDAVVALTSGTTATQAILEAVWRHLLPALGTAAGELGPDRAAERALADRLAGLALPPVPGGGPVGPVGSVVRAAGAVVVTVRGEAGEAGWPSRLADPVLTRTDAGWLLSLTEDGQRVEVPAGAGEWISGALTSPGGIPVPVAACAGPAADGGAQVDLLFLATPHRLTVRFPPPADVPDPADPDPADPVPARAQWDLCPLQARRLSELVIPPA